MSIRLSITTLFLCLCPLLLRAQDGAPVNIDSARWNLVFQATSIGQYHGAFNAAYSGENSLANHSEQDVSLTTTLFFGYRLTQNTYFYFDPEIAGGKGFSDVTE